MRIVNFILCALMLLFIVVQYNDPDGPMWMLIYSVPAVWAGLAAFRPVWLKLAGIRALLLLSILGAIAGIVYYWPGTPGWWTKDVWWETETAREGMGMMIVGVVTFIAWIGGRLYRDTADPHAGPNA